MFQILVEFTLLMLVFLVIGTQIVVPLIMGGPLFPVLRRDYKKTAQELREAQAEVEKAAIEAEVKETINKAEEIRSTTSKSNRKTTGKHTQ